METARQTEEIYIAKLRKRQRPEILGVPVFGKSYITSDDMLEGLSLTGIRPKTKARRFLIRNRSARFLIESGRLSGIRNMEQVGELLTSELMLIGGTIENG